MSKVFKLIVDESNEPLILEEDEVLEDILNHLQSISQRIDDIQYSLIKNNDEDSSLDLDISEIDFQNIKKYGVSITPYYVIIKIWETPSYFKLPFYSADSATDFFKSSIATLILLKVSSLPRI